MSWDWKSSWTVDVLGHAAILGAFIAILSSQHSGAETYLPLCLPIFAGLWAARGDDRLSFISILTGYSLWSLYGAYVLYSVAEGDSQYVFNARDSEEERLLLLSMLLVGVLLLLSFGIGRGMKRVYCYVRRKIEARHLEADAAQGSENLLEADSPREGDYPHLV
jgi:hypothetical protein